MTAPPAVVIGQPFNVTWNVTNTGNVPVANSFYDGIYLSSDDQPGDDTLLSSLLHDTLLDAEHTLVLECERASEFAPVKNATGVDSAQSARELMTALYRGWLEEAGATIVGNPQLEISPMRALDAEDLLAGGLHIDSDTYLE